MIMDWQRGNIPFFDLPPKDENEEEEIEKEEVEEDINMKEGEEEDEQIAGN